LPEALQFSAKAHFNRCATDVLRDIFLELA